MWPSQPHGARATMPTLLKKPGQALGGWTPACKTLLSELQALQLKQENPEPAWGRAGQGGSPEPRGGPGTR